MEDRKDLEERGKDRVWRVLIRPLQELQLRTPARVTVKDNTAGLEQVAAVLSYMTEDQLTALRHAVLHRASGKARDEWPTVASILNIAKTIAPPPPSDSDKVISFMASVGPRALAEGWHVELYRFLKTQPGCPTSDWEYAEMRRQAQENRRRVALVRERRDRGVADPDELAWLGKYLEWDDRARRVIPARDGEVAA